MCIDYNEILKCTFNIGYETISISHSQNNDQGHHGMVTTCFLANTKKIQIT